MIITRTPYRISFFGGGTDYPAWYRQHGGAVLATSINKYCYISCRLLPPFFDHHSRIVYAKTESVQSNREIQHPAVRACLAELGIEDGIEIHHDGDLPARTGLGTSSSFAVGLLQALYALRGQLRDKGHLAADAIRVEQEVLAENVGAQDQVQAAHGGFNRVEFYPDGHIAVHPLVATAERLREFQDHLLLYFTGFSRTASEIAAEQVRNVPHHFAELSALRAMVDESVAILSQPRRPLLEFGELLHDGWRIKRSLSTKVSTGEIDEIYEQGRRAGAIGGKLLGAGGGGFMLFFVPPERHAGFREKMRHLLWVPVAIGAPGAQVITYEPEEGYDPSLWHERERLYVAAV